MRMSQTTAAGPYRAAMPNAGGNAADMADDMAFLAYRVTMRCRARIRISTYRRSTRKVARLSSYRSSGHIENLEAEIERGQRPPCRSADGISAAQAELWRRRITSWRALSHGSECRH